MALMKSKEIPKDAVVLNEADATKYAWELVSDWDSFGDTWALLYGPVALGAINAASGLIINKHYRFKLKLGTYGYFASVIPITIMPALMTTLFHRQTVSTNMLLMKKETCPICLEMRSAALQFTLGLAYPMVLAPVSALMFANRYSTCRVPQLKEGPRIMFDYLKKLTRPLKGTLATLAVTQFVASSLVTYFEMQNTLSMRMKILEIENKLKNEGKFD